MEKKIEVRQTHFKHTVTEWKALAVKSGELVAGWSPQAKEAAQDTRMPIFPEKVLFNCNEPLRIGDVFTLEDSGLTYKVEFKSEDGTAYEAIPM